MNVAVAGLGFMGATHLKAWRQIPGVRVAAVVSSSAEKLSGDLTSMAGNLGGAGEIFDFSDVRKYASVEDAARNAGIDALDICLPTDRHESAAVAALTAGKHVLLEKPMALDFAGAERILRCAEENRRILMVAQVLRFIRAYRSARVWVQSAGEVRAAMFRRRCAAPAWNSWLGDKTRSGGGVFDLLIHDVDFCVSLWGMPQAVRATGYENPGAGVDLLHAELRYSGRPPVIVTGGWHPPQSFPFSMDFSLVSDAETLAWSSVGDTDSSDPFAAELQYFADCVGQNERPLLCPPVESALAVGLLRFMLESREQNGRTIRTV